jgi:hypothetical protein
MLHEPHCPVPRAKERGENAVCMCVKSPAKTRVVPTYDPAGEGDKEYDYSRPATITLKDEAGLRVILGDDGPELPSVMIERGINCWTVFIQPDHGDDLCCVVIHDEDLAVVTDSRGNLLLKKDLKTGHVQKEFS